jgi:hypothetical protein
MTLESAQVVALRAPARGGSSARPRGWTSRRLGGLGSEAVDEPDDTLWLCQNSY